ncbi:magnesium-translocating P-type ATPase [Nitrospira sp. NS4]|uniref:magnesium-translocating P-type ATPase n=1 Tax=Nitrospira sp. NS4 TaxID=3414498 RepID=UPI003C2F79DD
MIAKGTPVNDKPYWSIPPQELLTQLQTEPDGLRTAEARERQARYASARLKPHQDIRPLLVLLAQFRSPIVLILLFAAALSFFLASHTDALIILTIIVVSALLGFWQEHGAAKAVASLLALVRVKTEVWRDGQLVEVPLEDIIPGDVVNLSAGSSIPGDGIVLESKDLFVDEATLTGETYPAEKSAAVASPTAALNQRTNSLFLGTHVVSGNAKAVIVHVGKDTEFGGIASHVMLRPPETEFERGVRRFGYLLLEVTLLLVFAIFAINVYLNRPVLDSFLFSMALAVGLTPQLLPAIISVNLSHGAKRMARQKVIVKRLASIENFGSMNVLCSDKTGTLTEGTMRLHAALDLEGQKSERVMLYACLNATYETGFINPLDEAIRKQCLCDLSEYRKLDEVPYDFLRKRLSILVATPTTHLLITKGAVEPMLTVCTRAELPGGTMVPMDGCKEKIQQQFQDLNRQGLRTLGVAYRDMGDRPHIGKDEEAEMTFLGLMVFADPVKPDMAATIASLRRLGVSLKIVTGDHRLVAAHVSEQVQLDHQRLLTGQELRRMTDEALTQRVNDIDVFAEVEPNQKDRIILALKRSGNVVGYIGDGINDAPALHTADVGISVDGAVDVAKDAADIVLLEKNLAVLAQGVREGRTTFANTLKYVFMATSANFGNMFSMAGASLFLPFLPLLPKQILLTNLLTDIPEMTIATDRVDHELIDQPRRWDIAFIRRFMLTFGLVSSVFDYLTFGALLWILEASPEQFRTGWFIESVISASAIVLVIRTRRPFLTSRPGVPLMLATLGIAVLTLLFPFLPIASPFGLTPMPTSFLLLLAAILAGYVLTAEAVKHRFYAGIRNA